MKGTKQKGEKYFPSTESYRTIRAKKQPKKHGIEPRFVGQANQRERLSQAFALPS